MTTPPNILNRTWYGGPRFRIIVCGGTNYTDRAQVFAALGKAHAKRTIDVVAVRAAPGACEAATAWALARRVRCERLGMPGRDAAGVNRSLVESAPSGVVAFPGGPATADMVRRAVAAGLPVWRPYG